MAHTDRIKTLISALDKAIEKTYERKAPFVLLIADEEDDGILLTVSSNTSAEIAADILEGAQGSFDSEITPNKTTH